MQLSCAGATNVQGQDYQVTLINYADELRLKVGVDGSLGTSGYWADVAASQGAAGNPDVSWHFSHRMHFLWSGLTTMITNQARRNPKAIWPLGRGRLELKAAFTAWGVITLQRRCKRRLTRS